MDTKTKSLVAPLVSIVDDDISVRRSTRRLLRSAGFRVEAFASAEEFLTSGRAEETACLILDLRMPGMNGLQLQRRLAEASNLVPIIFVTAHFSADEERQALQAGAVQFLQKPVNKEVLLLAIRNEIKDSTR
ncbi:MAG: response regulator [Acidobacteriales bacterium]|nr:response regulator [Terriglobales bacterium]MCI0746296.1 response regulator [Limisphaerales bacterium]